MAHPLALTGERTLPGVPGEEYWYARHEAAYRWIAATYADRLGGAVVVEAGSGEGYGAELLRAAGARLVVALEYDEAAVAHAGSAYPRVVTARANLAALPLGRASVDVLVSLQVVEHLWDLRGFLRDCAAVLCPGGLLVVTTPNRPVFSPGLARGAKPLNPFHVEELDAEQRGDLLVSSGFTDVELLGVHHGERILAWERTHGSLVAAQLAVHTPAPDVTGGVVVSGAGKPPHDQLLADGLGLFVASVTPADFRVGVAEGAQDLVAVAVRP